MSDFQREFRRSQRILNLFVALPLIIVVGIWAGGFVPERARNIYYLVLMLSVLGTIFAVPIREHLRMQRRGGLVPKRPGFSGRLEIAAEKLREYARDLEELGPEDAYPAAALDSYIAELRRVAFAQDQRALATYLVLDIAENADGAKVRQHVARLRQAAGELELYAQDVRRRGGIFRLTSTQRVMGALPIAAAVFWGARLMLRTWATPSWTFFGGAMLVIAGCAIGYGLVMSQRDAA